MSFRPSHRNPNDIQPEVCDLCGNLIGHRHLIEADVEGLRGQAICDIHSFERRARVTPGRQDLRRSSRLPYAPEVGQRLPPVGGDLWFLDPENEE